MTNSQVPSDSSTPLSAVHRRLLEQRLRERVKTAGTEAGGTIPHAPRDRALPLSFGQERLWLLHHLEPDVTAYNSSYLYDLRGVLDVAALERSLLEIVRRHESLRTTIAVDEGNPYQLINDVAALPLPVAPVGTVAEARERARGAALARFDLARDVLLRPQLFRVSEAENLLLITVHHSAWDAWSTLIFWRELAACYAAFSAGRTPALPALAAQYADFATWQRSRLQGDVVDRLLTFWREQVDAVAPLELPSDRPRPAELTYAGEIVEFTWPADLRDALQAHARAEGASLFMVLLAGWSTLLHRLSGQDTVVTGTAVAGRSRRELETLIGFFVNTLALRTDCGGNPTFRELLQRVRATTLAVYDHDELPFEKLVADLRLPRDPARHPVFQTALVLHPADEGPAATKLAGLEVTTLPRVATHARFDLALTAAESANGIRGTLEFSTDLFDTATVRRWLGHLETLLRAATAEPGRRIADLPLLTPTERETLLGTWSGAPATYPRDSTAHELFAEQARRTPDAVALVEGTTQITYAELDARANHVARELENVAGTFVAIDLERSINFVVAVLAVLKAGAAYVPLLRDLPAARRRFILEDTKAVALICAEAPAGEVPEGVLIVHVGPDLASAPQHLPSRSRAVLPPQGGNGSAATRPQGPALHDSATDAAYVMYTSGSTGRPKGVVLPHRGIVRLVRGETPSRYAPGQRFLLLASTAFDASTFEMWAPLLNGATLVIFPDRWPEFDSLARVVRENGITHLFLTPGLFNQVIDHRPDILAGVTHLFTGGEAMSARHAARVQELWPELRVTNCYGPTEITTYTISHELAHGESWRGGNVPIGRPVPNARCHVLNPHGEPVPIGVPGELNLGGDGLAIGYLNLPELTAERFVADPFSPTPGARMYRTGDRARWRADGVLEFLGRLDDQVKIRGFRIEPGEIDAVLAQHPDVRDAAVIVREDQPGELRLVGYVVGRTDRAIDPAAMRSFLAERLPDYMVPAAIVTLPHLPLTSSGKIDRRALPTPEANLTAREPDKTEPRSPTEKRVASVWCTVLGGARPGLHENFFVLGGHSLLAMQATARLGSLLGREVPLRWWFEYPTIAALAGKIDRERELGNATDLAIAPIPRDDEMPLSHEEQRLWFLHHALPDPATYHVTWGWRLRGPLDIERLRTALAVVMRRHEILRTGYANRAGRPVRIIAVDCPVPLIVEEPARPRGASGDLVLERQLATEVRRPFALERPPLWRVTCQRLATEDHLVAFTAHHMVCDEWSLPVLHAELSAAYAGTADTFPQLTIQYADYAAWQRHRVASAAKKMQAARDFWREHLRNAPAAVALPVEQARTATSTGAGQRVYFPLRPAAADVVEKLGQNEGTTPFMTWLAVYAALLMRWTGQTDLVIGTPLAQRDREEVQPLIGFLLNTLPLRVRSNPRTTFRTLLRHVRTTVVDAFAHGELPLDAIAAAHPGARTAPGGALFNVMFVVHDATPPQLALPGIQTEPLELNTGTSKADLTFFVDRQAPGAPRGSIEFNSDLLAPSAIEGVIRKLQETLEKVAGDPDTVILDSGWTDMPQKGTALPLSPPSTSAAHPELERELIALWRRVLRRNDIGAHDNFFELGGHSLLAMQLVHEIQQQFGRTVPLARLLAAPTISALVRELAPESTATGAAAGGTAWKGSGSGTPYFHVPGMNGVEFLPPAVGQRIATDRRWFDGLQHPGTDGRMPPSNSLPAIAAELARQIRAAQPRGPYALGGFCHGGLVAFEVARQLEAHGERVTALVLWDTFPIHCWRRRRVGEMFRVLGERLTAAGAGTFLADRWRFLFHRVHLGWQFLGRVIRAWLPGRRGRTEARMISAGMRARRHYVPGSLRAPVLLVRSRDERVVVDKLPQDGWADAFLGPCTVVDLPYWHFHLLREPAVSELAERTAEFLRRADQA